MFKLSQICCIRRYSNMYGIKLKYTSSALQMYFNCYEIILLKYHFWPYKLGGIGEIYNKTWKKANCYQNQRKLAIASYFKTENWRTRQAISMWNYNKIDPVVLKWGGNCRRHTLLWLLITIFVQLPNQLTIQKDMMDSTVDL